MPNPMPSMRNSTGSAAKVATQKQDAAHGSLWQADWVMPRDTHRRKTAVTPDPIRLTPEELIALTGYRRPAEQLAELHALGYWRARRNRLGEVVVERAHYQEVCAGTAKAPKSAGRAQPVLQ